MTTITLSDKSLLLDGHAGNRDVCVSLAAMSQLIAATLAQSEAKEPGRHEIWFTHYAATVYVELIDAFTEVVSEMASLFPDYVVFNDARR